MLSLKFLGDLVFIYLPSVFFLYVVFFKLRKRYPYLFSIKLKRINLEKYNIAREINGHPSITIGEVDLLVDFGFILFYPFYRKFFAYTYPSFYPRVVFFNPLRFNIKNFDVLVAHEMGHLQDNDLHKKNYIQQEVWADEFASLICGKERVIEAIIENHWKYGEFSIHNLKSGSPNK